MNFEKMNVVNIELFGIPGSGKSYFTKRLVGRNKKLKNYILWERSSIIGRIVKKIAMFTISFFYSSKIKCMSDKYIETSSVEALYTAHKDIQEYFERIIYLMFIYRLAAMFKISIVTDEGILHTVATMVVDFDVTLKNRNQIYKLISDTDLCIYNHVSVDKAIESIRVRDRHVTQIDDLSPEKLNQFLMGYSQACDSLYAESQANQLVSIDRDNPIEKNIKYIEDMLMEVKG